MAELSDHANDLLRQIQRIAPDDQGRRYVPLTHDNAVRVVDAINELARAGLVAWDGAGSALVCVLLPRPN